MAGDVRVKKEGEREQNRLSPPLLFLSLAFFHPASTTESLEQDRNSKTPIIRTHVRLEFFDDFKVKITNIVANRTLISRQLNGLLFGNSIIQSFDPFSKISEFMVE